MTCLHKFHDIFHCIYHYKFHFSKSQVLTPRLFQLNHLHRERKKVIVKYILRTFPPLYIKISNSSTAFVIPSEEGRRLLCLSFAQFCLVLFFANIMSKEQIISPFLIKMLLFMINRKKKNKIKLLKPLL